MQPFNLLTLGLGQASLVDHYSLPGLLQLTRQLVYVLGKKAEGQLRAEKPGGGFKPPLKLLQDKYGESMCIIIHCRNIEISDAGEQVLDGLWIYVYKFDKHVCLLQCKARLGDQQTKSELARMQNTCSTVIPYFYGPL
jgi:hypothetical protein